MILYSSGRNYKLVYISDSQRLILKSEITDLGYANYLFDKFLKDFNIKKFNNLKSNTEIVEKLLVMLECMSVKCSYKYETNEVSEDIIKLKELVVLIG